MEIEYKDIINEIEINKFKKEEKKYAFLFINEILNNKWLRVKAIRERKLETKNFNEAKKILTKDYSGHGMKLLSNHEIK